MKRLVLLSAVLGTAMFFLAYGPITVNVNVSTGNDGTSSTGPTLGGISEADAAMLSGTSGNDDLTGTINRDFFLGKEGDDTLSGGDGKDVMNGGTGNDTIYGGRHGDNLIGGEQGQDNLYGGSGDDVLTGLSNDEGATPDILDCGAGAGDFAFHNPDDTLIGCENHSTEWFVIQDTP